MVPRLLRSGAIVIAILGVIDPRITVTRPVTPVVAVVDTTPPGAAGDRLADRVARGLDGSFTIVRHAFPGVAAVVAVGDRAPDDAAAGGSPGFAVIREPLAPTIEIVGVAAPARAPLDARVTIDATLRAAGAKGDKIEVILSAGDLVVDRASHNVATDDERFTAALTFVPATAGLAGLRITAGAAGDAGAAGATSADLAIDVRRQPWSVLVFDGHPSWASTFVRRALEHDARFSVTTRVDTSRDVATSIGQPPASLASLDALLGYDAIVIGGLDDLTPADVGGLEAFARRRAGGIIAVLDKAPSSKYASLLRVDRWIESTNSATLAIEATAPMPARLQASELIWPEALPPGAESLATVPVGGAAHPAVWRMPLGAGRIVVSGALDAWRTRAAAASTFDEYWRAIVADAAEPSPPALALSIEPAIAEPGETATVHATLRDLAPGLGATSSARASIVARLEGPDGSSPVRLWPDGAIGRWRGQVRIPSPTGGYRIVAESGTLTAVAPVRVAMSVTRLAPDGRDELRAWAASRGGSTIPASRAGEIRDVVARTLTTTSAPQTWRPLRSSWWIMPFALLLGGEWWWRRRRGLR